MGRPLRIDVAGGMHHVINRGVDRCDIFRGDRDRVEFERLIGLAHDRFGVVVHLYCWMSNHYHLVLECPDGGISDAMHLIGSTYVRHFNERHGRDGPLFRDRFFAKPVTSDAYLIRLVRYIHRNPLAFLTPAELARYRWSSLRPLLGYRHAPPWLSTDTVLAVCGGPVSLEELVVGGQTEATGPLSPEVWNAAIEVALEADPDTQRRPRIARTIASLVLDRLDESDRTPVAELLSFPDRRAETTARARARHQLAARPELAAVVDAVIDFAA